MFVEKRRLDLLDQIEFGRAELRHSNCATLRTCILRFAIVVHIGLGLNNRPCVHSGSLIWKGLSPVPYTSGFLFRFAVFLIGFRLHRISTSKRREQ